MLRAHALGLLLLTIVVVLTITPSASSGVIVNDISYGPCTLRAIGPETGGSIERWGRGRLRISCVSPYFLEYQVCTQKMSSVFVLEEKCSSQSWLFSAGQTIFPTGPTLYTNNPSCQLVNWKSRVKAYGQSHTSAAYC